MGKFRTGRKADVIGSSKFINFKKWRENVVSFSVKQYGSQTAEWSRVATFLKDPRPAIAHAQRIIGSVVRAGENEPWMIVVNEFNGQVVWNSIEGSTP